MTVNTLKILFTGKFINFLGKKINLGLVRKKVIRNLYTYIVSQKVMSYQSGFVGGFLFADRTVEGGARGQYTVQFVFKMYNYVCP